MTNKYMPSNSSGSSGMNYGQGSPSALASYEPKKTKPRSKASDTSKMNPVYKPKASPGPVNQSFNLRPTASQSFNLPKPKTGSQSFYIPTPKPKSKPNFTYSAPKADKVKPKARPNIAAKPKAKSKNVGGFKPGSIGAKAIGSLKKAYQGK